MRPRRTECRTRTYDLLLVRQPLLPAELILYIMLIFYLVLGQRWNHNTWSYNLYFILYKYYIIIFLKNQLRSIHIVISSLSPVTLPLLGQLNEYAYKLIFIAMKRPSQLAFYLSAGGLCLNLRSRGISETSFLVFRNMGEEQ